MRFCEIIGQEGVKKQLCQAVQEGRIAHAQLFTGLSGVGKMGLALAYAQYLACPNRTESDSCGVCPSCLQYQKLQHPDLHFAFPIVKGDNGDVCDEFVDKFREMVLEGVYFDLDDWYRRMGVETKQGMIYEKESSEILRKLSLKSFGDGYKVMLIWQPEKMNGTCANKLLKLLEEPPEKTLFLLVSEHPELLLTTVLSRAQEVRVPRLSEGEIADALQQQYPWLETQAATSVAHMANGSYLTALRVMNDSEENQGYFDDFVALMRNAWLVGQKKDYSALLKVDLDTMSQGTFEYIYNDLNQRRFTRHTTIAGGPYKFVENYANVNNIIFENYIYNFGCAEMNYQTDKEQGFSTKFAPFIHDGNVEKMMEE